MADIALERVTFAFGSSRAAQLPVLQDVSLQVERGEFVVLLGPSGCGKSTILNLMAGFETPQQGRILSQDRLVTGPSPSRGMVFQQPLLYPWLSVFDNVTFGPRMQGLPEADWRPRATELLQQMGLQRHHDANPWELSGGMKQRVALARAWIMRPEVLLMDEPFGALDAQTRSLMQELLLETWRRLRTTVVFVTHDVDEAILLGTRIVVMSARPGRIREQINVPVAAGPRDAEVLASDPVCRNIKAHALHLVREEARRHLAVQ